MKYEKLFLKLTLINLSIFSILYFSIMEYLIRKYIINLDHDFLRSRLFKKSKTKNTIWGDSASMTAINQLKDFANFSAASQNYHEIELKIKEYYADKSPGGKLILQLSLNGFAPYRDRQLSDAVNELYFDKKEKTNLYISKNYFRKRSYEYFKNFISNKFTIKAKDNERFNDDGSVTYFEIFKARNANSTKQKKINVYNNYVPALNFEKSQNFNSLNNILDFLKNRNIEVCLISTPIHNDFFMFEVKEKSFQEVKSFYTDISKKNNIRYFDFTNLKLPNEAFQNLNHLNDKGAKIFTSLVENNCFT